MNFIKKFLSLSLGINNDHGNLVFLSTITKIPYVVLSTTMFPINSLYIVIKSDDTDPNYAYRGDDKNTPGINIGIKNIIP